jgi:hypothetical protein
MENNRDIKPLRVFLAFLIATFILITIFLISFSVAYYRSQTINDDQEKIRYRLLELSLQEELSNQCGSSLLSALSSDLDNMGGSLGMLEDKLGKNDPDVLEQKKTYTMLELQHYLVSKRQSSLCGEEIKFILFFYSNGEEYKEKAEEIGYILSTAKRNNPEGIMVYSFDYDLNSNMISILKTKYALTGPNVLVVNDELIGSIDSIDDLDEYLE